MQLEGSKRWRLYDRPDAATHPAADRTTEFAPNQLGEIIDEFTLHVGDLLYLPRGVVHQALAQDGSIAMAASASLVAATNRRIARCT